MDSTVERQRPGRQPGGGHLQLWQPGTEQGEMIGTGGVVVKLF